MEQKNNKRKIIIIIVLILIGILFITNQEKEYDNLRIRVIANSDSYIDQKIKYECVDILKNIINVNDTKEQINKKIIYIEKSLEEVEKKYKVEIETGINIMNFPPKTLNDKLIPGGDYETLYIKIGKAKGKNYWTLLYPEYFDISFEDIYTGDVEIKFFFKELLNK